MELQGRVESQVEEGPESLLGSCSVRIYDARGARSSLEALWRHFGGTLEALWRHFGALWRHFEGSYSRGAHVCIMLETSYEWFRHPLRQKSV
jgi:hypothetical protein